MELGEKLQILRKQKDLTQEELAEKLFVSRTAISKWESGRGYPNMESLRQLSNFFGCSLDFLMSEDACEESAQSEKKKQTFKRMHLICAGIDVLFFLFFFLPLFGEKIENRLVMVNLIQLQSGVGFMKPIFIVFIALTICNGLFGLIIENFNLAIVSKYSLLFGVGFSVCCVVSFLLTRQVYPTFFAFVLVLTKLFLQIKTK